MNNFWTLVGFELKKITGRKSAIVFLVISFVVVIFSCFAMVIGKNSSSDYIMQGMSNYDAMKMDKEYEKRLEGREFNAELIVEASDAYKRIDENTTGDKYYTETEEYQKYARPYSKVYGLVRQSGYGGTFNVDDFKNLSYDEAKNFYNYREKQYRVNLTNNPLFSASDVDKVMSLDEEVQKPFVMAYTDGYDRFFVLSMSTFAIVLLVISFWVSPIFSSEYTNRMDSIILTTKNGRGDFIYSKIVSALIISFGISLVFVIGSYLACMGVYGFDGANAQIQMMKPSLTYNFSMSYTTVLLIIISLFAAYLHTAICLFFSSISRNPLIPMSVSSVLIVLGWYNLSSNVFIMKLRYFLPSSMGNFWDVIDTQLVFELLGVQIMLYQMVVIVAFVVGSVLFVLSYLNFRNHQIA